MTTSTILLTVLGSLVLIVLLFWWLIKTFRMGEDEKEIYELKK